MFLNWLEVVQDNSVTGFCVGGDEPFFHKSLLFLDQMNKFQMFEVEHWLCSLDVVIMYTPLMWKLWRTWYKMWHVCRSVSGVVWTGFSGHIQTGKLSSGLCINELWSVERRNKITSSFHEVRTIRTVLFLDLSPKEEDHLEDQGVDGRMESNGP
jgi:hypothetical protein